MQLKNIKTKGEAEDFAVEWSHWVSGQALGYGDVQKWEEYFSELTTRFDLEEEFKENGII